MLTGRRYLLALTPDQQEAVQEWAGACRAVWNTALAQRRAYRERGAFIGYVAQAREMAEAKRHPGLEWLAQPPSHVLQQTLRDLDQACQRHGTWKMRWRSRARWAPSMRFPEGRLIEVERLSRRWGRAKLPKLGWVRFRWTRPPGGQIRYATVTRNGGKWWISLCVEDRRTRPDQHRNLEHAVGVDRGVAVAAATSDGQLHDREFATPAEEDRLRRLQQRLARSRRVHGRNRASKRREATRAELTALWARIRNRRTDFHHQLAHDLCQANAMVAVEALKTRNMTASARGTVQEPGRRVRQKAGLNRAILDKGWHAFGLALQNQARYTGTKIVEVDPAYTSQRCAQCQHLDPVSRESQTRFRCTHCQHQAQADVNAARNILAAGRAATGRGDLAVRQSVKRQPPTSAPSDALVGIPRL